MPVRLNTIPDAEPYPAPPAHIKWLSALLLMLSMGVALTSLFASDELAKTARISGGWPVVCLPLSGRWSVRCAGWCLLRNIFVPMRGISAAKR